MERLTEINERGDGIDCYPKSGELLGFVIGQEHPLYNIVKKLTEYEGLEERLCAIYGSCDGLLEKTVEHLERHEGVDLPEPLFRARLLTDGEVDRWEEFKDLEEQGKLLRLPVAVEDTVYVLAECENIPEQLDGTLWDENGAHGTATGYYCPYEDSCPFDDEDFEDCKKYKAKTSVFEDTVVSITIDESGVWITTQNCMVNSQIGLYVFLTKEAAEAALKEMSEK